LKSTLKAHQSVSGWHLHSPKPNLFAQNKLTNRLAFL